MSEPFVLLPLLSSTTITAIQTVIVAVLVFAGQFAVAKMSNKARGKKVTVDSQTAATTAWQAYATEMKERMSRLEAMVNEQNSRIRTLERQSARDTDLIYRLARRLRGAMREIVRLGGSVDDEDHELADLAELRVAPEKEVP